MEVSFANVCKSFILICNQNQIMQAIVHITHQDHTYSATVVGGFVDSLKSYLKTEADGLRYTVVDQPIEFSKDSSKEFKAEVTAATKPYRPLPEIS